MDLPTILSALLRKPSQWSHFFTLQTHSSSFTARCFYINTTTVSLSVPETGATSPKDSGHSQNSSPGDPPVAFHSGSGTLGGFCGDLFFSGLLCEVYKTLTLPGERGFPYLQCTPYLQTHHPLGMTWDLLRLFERSKLSWSPCRANSLLSSSPGERTQDAVLAGNYWLF